MRSLAKRASPPPPTSTSVDWAKRMPPPLQTAAKTEIAVGKRRGRRRKKNKGTLILVAGISFLLRPIWVVCRCGDFSNSATPTIAAVASGVREKNAFLHYLLFFAFLRPHNEFPEIPAPAVPLFSLSLPPISPEELEEPHKRFLNSTNHIQTVTPLPPCCNRGTCLIPEIERNEKQLSHTKIYSCTSEFAGNKLQRVATLSR